jgi:hypothetical protein
MLLNIAEDLKEYAKIKTAPGGENLKTSATTKVDKSKKSEKPKTMD